MIELTEELIRKHRDIVEATVKGYTKHSKTGKTFNVRQYERTYKKGQEVNYTIKSGGGKESGIGHVIRDLGSKLLINSGDGSRIKISKSSIDRPSRKKKGGVFSLGFDRSMVNDRSMTGVMGWTGKSPKSGNKKYAHQAFPTGIGKRRKKKSDTGIP